jgi:hypothetical protein
MKEIDAMLREVTEEEVRETISVLGKQAAPRPARAQGEAHA